MLKTVVFSLLMGISLNSTAAELPVLSGVGGEFTAVNTDGETVQFSQYQGKVSILAFGYTNCADICPFTLGYLKRLYAQLSVEEQQQTYFIFSTVDPEYDTPVHLGAFVKHFNKDFIGFSGTKVQTDYIASLFQAEYHKLSDADVPTKSIRRITEKEFEDEAGAEEDTTTLYSHSVTIYLMDKDGDVRSLEYTGTPIEDFAGRIRQLIAED